MLQRVRRIQRAEYEDDDHVAELPVGPDIFGILRAECQAKEFVRPGGRHRNASQHQRVFKAGGIGAPEIFIPHGHCDEEEAPADGKRAPRKIGQVKHFGEKRLPEIFPEQQRNEDHAGHEDLLDGWLHIDEGLLLKQDTDEAEAADDGRREDHHLRDGLTLDDLLAEETEHQDDQHAGGPVDGGVLVDQPAEQLDAAEHIVGEDEADHGDEIAPDLVCLVGGRADTFCSAVGGAIAGRRGRGRLGHGIPYARERLPVQLATVFS